MLFSCPLPHRKPNSQVYEASYDLESLQELVTEFILGSWHHFREGSFVVNPCFRHYLPGRTPYCNLLDLIIDTDLISPRLGFLICKEGLLIPDAPVLELTSHGENCMKKHMKII